MGKFKSGDLVKINSDGPKMTVRGYTQVQPKELVHTNDTADKYVVCDWFWKEDFKQNVFVEDQLFKC